MAEDVLKAPFPYHGGKAAVADLVWARLGNVDNYVEPFMGSLAVLLRRPAAHFRAGHRVETVNDASHFVVNFWRAVAADPDGVAAYADSPVTEADLHARHTWLVRSEFAAGWRDRMRTDPDHYDAKVAGWWVWGLCCWIGSGWCEDGGRRKIPLLDGGGHGHGVNSGPSQQIPEMVVMRGVPGRPAPSTQLPLLSHAGGKGVDALPAGGRQIPLISGPGDGVDAVAGSQGPRRGRPQLADAYDIGRGVNGGGKVGSTQRPDLAGGNSGAADGATVPGLATCADRRAWLVAWMRRLADRLRLVRTCYGHWTRVCDSDSTVTRLGITGVFLDPPYPLRTEKGTRAKGLYANDGQDLDALRDEVLAWCRAWGPVPAVRVAVCGYEGDGYEALEADGWAVEAWEAQGGYGNQSKKNPGKNANAKRERIWFSQHCLRPAPDLFAGVEADHTGGG